MAGRKPKPAKLIKAEGNKLHLSKKQLEDREKGEISLGDSVFKVTAAVKKNKVAFEKWQELVKLYEGVPLVTSADVSIMSQYCLTWAEYLDLEEHRENIQMVDFDPSESLELADELEDQLGKRRGRAYFKRLWEKIEYLTSVSGLIAVDKAINQKISVLTSLEDRLFLSPLARIKSIPVKKEEPPKDPLKEAGFDI